MDITAILLTKIKNVYTSAIDGKVSEKGTNLKWNSGEPNVSLSWELKNSNERQVKLLLINSKQFTSFNYLFILTLKPYSGQMWAK